jgi:hypothetical protein
MTQLCWHLHPRRPGIDTGKKNIEFGTGVLQLEEIPHHLNDTTTPNTSLGLFPCHPANTYLKLEHSGSWHFCAYLKAEKSKTKYTWLFL